MRDKALFQTNRSYRYLKEKPGKSVKRVERGGGGALHPAISCTTVQLNT